MKEIKIMNPQENIKIGTEIFTFTYTNEALAAAYDALNEVKGMKAETGAEMITMLEAILKKTINIMFLNQPFDKIYKACGGNIISCFIAFNDAANTIMGKLASLSKKR